MNREGIEEIIKKNPELAGKLFARGFLFTNSLPEEMNYPFYGLWKKEKADDFILLTAPETNAYRCSQDKLDLLLIGHAYNPFKMISDENILLQMLRNAFSEKEMKDRESVFWKLVHELTGVYTLIILNKETGKVFLLGDPSGMQTAFYTKYEGKIFISSHTNMIGDLLHLSWDPYIEELVHYRFFKLLGNSLPGDLTQFKKVKRLVPNHYVSFDRDRIYTKRFYCPAKCDISIEEAAEECGMLMNANMKMIREKWKRPAISLTGGCDSKTTLACTAGMYDKFTYFSYISSEAEEVDAVAAEKICKEIGLKHTIYHIPEKDDKLSQVNEAREIINWNTGGIRYSHPNDVRKRVYFNNLDDFDVEVKSWASEIGRAYYSKRFHGRTQFGKITPRKCTTLYKFFLGNRELVKKTDQVFKAYLDRYFEVDRERPIEWQDQFFWEFRVPSWNGLVITGEHRYSFDITIPYNNRRILELLLSVPIEARLKDNVYSEIRKKMNSAIDSSGISVTNLKHTKNREKMERLYYDIHSVLPY